MIAHKRTDELGCKVLQFEVYWNELNEDQVATEKRVRGWCKPSVIDAKLHSSVHVTAR